MTGAKIKMVIGEFYGQINTNSTPSLVS